MAVRERIALVPRLPGKGGLLAGVLAVWLAGWLLLRGTDTLQLGASQLTGLHQWLNDVNDAIGASRDTNPVFLYFFNVIRLVVGEFAMAVQSLIAQPAFGSPVPLLGWLGVVAVAGYVSYAVAGVRIALPAMAGFVVVGLQGLWSESMDTLALTIAAVLISLAFAIPIGVCAGLSDRFNRVITPVLDFMQTMPTFVYLAPLTLFFLIGPASATIATLLYAAPPAIRLTAHGIRSAPSDVVEAGMSLGSTRWQLLTKVLLPTARRTIVLGINQTMMAALAMVTIAALINAPGLGQTVVQALQSQDVGTAFNAGLAIVVLAVVLDRVTTAAVTRSNAVRARNLGRRRLILLGGAVVTAVGVWYSRTYVWAARFPEGSGVGDVVVGTVDAVAGWISAHFAMETTALKNGVTSVLIDPLQALLVQSPWWLVFTVIVAISAIVGGVRPAVISAMCLALVLGSGLWHASMTTLAQVLLATVVVLILGLAVGVWIGRSPRVDRVVRPVLDAAQTMPPFVYLVPFLALFDASRFTAIVAAVVYASPVAIKIVSDGIRGVSRSTVEAATAAGSSTWQIITKIQIPMARNALTLATNQGLIYVLAMVVVGGLVGAGALGYLVVAGFSQSELYGKGLAAGIAIVLLGVLLDRTTQAATHKPEHPASRKGA